MMITESRHDLTVGHVVERVILAEQFHTVRVSHTLGFGHIARTEACRRGHAEGACRSSGTSNRTISNSSRPLKGDERAVACRGEAPIRRGFPLPRSGDRKWGMSDPNQTYPKLEPGALSLHLRQEYKKPRLSLKFAPLERAAISAG